MKNGIYLFIILTLIVSCSSSKVNVKKELNYIPYYLKVYEADSLYITKNYDKTFIILDNLFKYYKPINLPTYYEYVNYIKSAYKTKGLDRENLKSLI